MEIWHPLHGRNLEQMTLLVELLMKDKRQIKFGVKALKVTYKISK